MLELLEQIIMRGEAGEALALCTLISTRGSCPQEKGAKMLVLASGQTVGTLGGGCVEAEVRSAALAQISAGESRRLTFKLDHDYGWDDGLICGGTMEVYVQYLRGPADVAPFAEIARAIRAREPTAFYIEKIYTEAIEPAPLLLIVGAGHVGQALAAIAPGLGFNVAIMDDRPDFVSAARFPHASQRIAGDIEVELGRFPLDAFSYVVIVTRGHKRDGRALAAVIRAPACYLGLIGSKRKVVTILADLARDGVELEWLHRVHAPIGLAIGAVTVPEIAISIASELIAVRRHHSLPAASMQLAPEMLAAALQRPAT